MNKNEIISKIAKAVNFDSAAIIRDNIIRGENKVISESEMKRFWNSFGEMKKDVIAHLENEEAGENITNQVNKVLEVAREMAREITREVKTVTVVPFQASCSKVTVPANWTVKQILDNFEPVNIDIETGQWDVRVNGGEPCVANAEFIVPANGDFIQVATKSKGN